MDSTAVILFGVLFGSVGFGYFIYGKKQANPVARYAGIALMVFPYFITNVIALMLIGIVLMAIPWFIKR